VTALLLEARCTAATPTIVAIIKNKHIKARAFERTDRRNITTAPFSCCNPRLLGTLRTANKRASAPGVWPRRLKSLGSCYLKRRRNKYALAHIVRDARRNGVLHKQKTKRVVEGGTVAEAAQRVLTSPPDRLSAVSFVQC